VWTRIQRQRRVRQLAAFAVAAAAGWMGGQLVRHRTAPRPAAVRVSVELLGSLRPEGSTSLPALWQVRFAGAELRIYRNALGVVHRCPGSVGCTATPSGGVLTLPLDEAGEYRALVFSRPDPGDGSTLQRDLEAARRRGDQVGMSPPLIAY
jgi:hypothetical protein